MNLDSIKDIFKKKAEPESDEPVASFEEIVARKHPYTKYDVPSDWNQVWTITMLEFKHFLKTKSFFVLFILAAMVPIIQMTGLLDIVGGFTAFMSLFGGASGNVTGNVYLHYCLCFVPLVMLLCMVFFCGKTISNEYANRTAFLNMPQPMKRWVIFTGKFIAISLISFSIILFAYGTAFVATAMKYDQILVIPVFQSLLVSFFCMLALVATGMLFSSFMKNRGGALAFLTLFVFIPVGIPLLVSIITSLFKMDYNIDFLQYSLPFLIDDAFMLISFDPMLSVPSILTLLTPLTIPAVWQMVLICIIWAGLCFAGGLYLFDKKEV